MGRLAKKHHRLPLLLAGSLFLVGLSVARAERQATHAHGAHLHGAAKLALACENPSQCEGDFDVPAEAIIGFEHPATTPAQKKQEADGLARFEKTLGDLFQIPRALGCQFSSAHAQREAGGEANHADISGSFKLQCEQPILGVQVKTKLFQEFPKIKSLTVALVLPKSASEQRLDEKHNVLDFSGK